MKAKLRGIIGEFVRYSQGRLPRGEVKVLVASNGKARAFIDEKFSLDGLTVVPARGEDIPSLVDIWPGSRYIGITTTEYTAEYFMLNKLPDRLAKGFNGQLVEYTLPWYDRTFLLGEPVLAVLGKPNPIPESGRVRIAVNNKIAAVSGRLARIALERCGLRTKWLLEGTEDESREDRMEILRLNGTLETAVTESFADLCVDRVATGTTFKERGLNPYSDEVIRIGLSIVANKNYLSQLQGR